MLNTVTVNTDHQESRCCWKHVFRVGRPESGNGREEGHCLTTVKSLEWQRQKFLHSHLLSCFFKSSVPLSSIANRSCGFIHPQLHHTLQGDLSQTPWPMVIKLWVGMDWKIICAKISFPDLNRICAHRKYMYFLMAIKSVTVCEQLPPLSVGTKAVVRCYAVLFYNWEEAVCVCVSSCEVKSFFVSHKNRFSVDQQQTHSRCAWAFSVSVLFSLLLPSPWLSPPPPPSFYLSCYGR